MTSSRRDQDPTALRDPDARPAEGKAGARPVHAWSARPGDGSRRRSAALLLPLLASLGLGGCVTYAEPVAYAPPPRPIYVAPVPVYVAPPPPRRVWVPRRCDRWGRCWGGYWR